MQYAQWGDVVFELLAYAEHKEENEYVYAKHQTIFPSSSLQWMGTELKRISMTIRWHVSWTDPLKQYKALKEISQQGEAKKLIIAQEVIGDFVLEKITAEIQQLDIWGKPIQIQCQCEFTEYIKKEIEKKKIQTKKQSPAKKQTGQPEYKVVKKTNPEGEQFSYVEKVK